MTCELTAEQWTELLSLLSLDGAMPLYEAMRVPVANKGTFQTTLRMVILEARQLYETSPGSIPPVGTMLCERLTKEEARRFGYWTQCIFLGYHADQPDWSAWDIVLSQWAFSRRRELDFLPQQKRESLIAGYQQKVVTDDIRQKSEEILRQPLSDWDLEIFARRGYGISWESSPYSTAEAIVRIERLKQHVAVVWSELESTEKKQLHEKAQTLINDLGVWMPGPLPYLDLLLKESF